MEPVLTIRDQLLSLGVEPGGVLVVHTAFSKIAPVEGGPLGLIEALLGPRAAELTAPHPIDVPHGHDSPPGRAYDLDAQVLLLGVGHDANTTIHVAENLAGMRYFRPQHVTILRDGAPVRFDYVELDHCCENVYEGSLNTTAAATGNGSERGRSSHFELLHPRILACRDDFEGTGRST